MPRFKRNSQDGLGIEGAGRTKVMNEERKKRRGNKNKINLNKLSIFYQNVRGMKSKLPSLQVIVAEHNPSLICITETHLCEEDPDKCCITEGDQNTISFEGYIMIRNDRAGIGGGCLIAYKTEMASWSPN